MRKITLRILIPIIMLLLLSSYICFAENTQEKKIIFVTDQEADFHLYEKPVKEGTSIVINYVPFTEVSPEEIETGTFRAASNDTTVYKRYVFDITNGIQGGNATNYSFRVTEPGRITQAGWIRSFDVCDPSDENSFHDLTNPDMLDNTARMDYSSDGTGYGSYAGIYFDDGMLVNTNADGSSSLELCPGDTFRLKAYRTWQIIEDTNYLIEPDFHFEVVLGDSVTVDTNGLATAQHEGFSIIRITYDAIDVGYLGTLARYNATDPVCIGIVAVNVAADPSADFQTGIHLTEYDTVYFDKSITDPTGNTIATGNTFASYTFTPDPGTDVAVLEAPDLKAAFSGKWTEDWTPYTPSNNGAVTVHLSPGKNIIRLSQGDNVKYHVIRSASLGVSIENQTAAGSPLAVGDTAVISLDGLYLPVPKMAAVYNPGLFTYTGTTTPCVQYFIDGIQYKSDGNQYALRNTNRLYVDLDDDGDFILTNGQISEGYMGDSSITHYNIPEIGLIRNFNANGILGLYDILPDISLHVDTDRTIDSNLENRLKQLAILTNSTDYPFLLTEPDAEVIRSNPGNGLTGDTYLHSQIVDLHARLTLSKQPVYPHLVGSCYCDDVTAVFRYWAEDDETIYTQISIGGHFDFSAEEIVPSSNNTRVFAELTIIPEDTSIEPYTYSFLMNYILSGGLDVMPYLSNIQLISGSAGGFYEQTDGILYSISSVYTDPSGAELPLDFGEGYLVTEYDYEVSVPESEPELSLDLSWMRRVSYADNQYATAILTVDGIDDYRQELIGPEPETANSVITDPIPLNETGDTTIRIRLTSTESMFSGVENEYTIRVTKHPLISKQTVTLNPVTEHTSLVVNNDAGRRVTPGEDGTWLLPDGEYTYTASCEGYRTAEGTFVVDTAEADEHTIEIPALEGPRSVSFVCETEGAQITVRNARNKVITPVGDTYPLIGGDTYTWYASAPGYLTSRETFTAGDEETQIISIPDLEKALLYPSDDRVFVSIVSDTNYLISGYQVPMTDDPEALDLGSYVDYNNGSFTALHALIATLDADQGIDYTCRKGNLKVITQLGGTYENGSWVCEVNGEPVADPSQFPLVPGDQVTLYYSKGYEGMMHAQFSTSAYDVTEGHSIRLKLYGHPVGEGSDTTPLGGATVYVNQQEAGTTDSNGMITISDLTLSGSPYIVTAKLKNDAGEDILTYNQCRIFVQSETAAFGDSETVRFRLIGDDAHGGNGHSSYVTWIATEDIPLTEDTLTVRDVILKALGSAGLDYSGSDNYISGIQAPDSLGGYLLSEFTNGEHSGWMYTLNGVHTQLGVGEQEVYDGDTIVLHYVDDYILEEYNYTWLEAKDVNPDGIEPYAIAALREQLSTLPEIDALTLSDEPMVDAALAAYEALNDSYKAMLDQDTLSILTDAQARIEQLHIDEDAVANATDTILASIPNAEELTLSDKSAVAAARDAYNALTDSQKDAVDPAVLKLLTDAEAKLAELQAAEDAKNQNTSSGNGNGSGSGAAGTGTNTAPATQTTAVKVGDVKTISNLIYKVTSVSSGSKTVTVTGMKNKKKTKAVIPATVKIDKESYKVTAIADKAFKSCKKLKKVTIGKNVKTIGKNAFQNCAKLKKITVKSTVLKKVGANALKKIHKKAVVKVPKKKLKAYKKLFKKKGQAKTVKIKK